jgi:MSHA biogenesis protein MshQ
LNLNVTINFGSASRYDIGVFLSNNGKDPSLTSATSCSVAVLPTSSPFLNLDGDSCGDGNSSINGGTGSGSFAMNNVTVPCTTDGSGNTILYIPYVITWDQSASNFCGDNTYPVPGTTSKCNKGSVTFPPGTTIIVLPAITKTDGRTTVRTGDALTYTIVISSSTGSTVSGAVFADPAVAGLSISGISCVAAGGATCPASPTVSAMQGAGITLPNMPSASTLTFTVTGTYTGTPTSPTTLTNTASVTLNGQTNSASDTDTVMVPPTVTKSFSPAAINPGDTSILTVTLTNPTTTVNITGAAFTDIYPGGMTNSSTPTLTNSCGGTATAVANGSSLSLSGATIPQGASCAVTVRVTTTATVTNSTGAVTSTNAASGSSASATLDLIGSVSNFNAFESSTAAAAITGSIYTKLAGAAYSLDVVAIAGGSKASSFNDNVKVELLANTGTAGSGYGPDNCPASNSVIQTIASAAIASGRSTVNFAAVPNAYRDVRVRISYPTASPTVTVCSNDSFAIRPQAFSVTSTDATNTNTSGTPVIKAGANFNLTAASVAGYDGTPSIDNTLGMIVGTTTAGTIGGSFSAAPPATGTATGASFSYSEVGHFGLSANAVYDSSFTSVDQPNDCTNDFSNILVGGKFGCSIGSTAVAQTTGSSGFGRFTPAYFDVTKIDGCTGGGAFTYSGQPFSQVKVSAKAAGATVTRNYDGTLGFAKNVGLSDGGGSTAGTFFPAVTVSGDFTAAGFVNGEQTKTDVNYKFTVKETASLPLTLRAIDTDLVSSAGHTEDAAAIRSGRIHISNAYGSELVDLPTSMLVEYYADTTITDPANPISTTGWVASTGDTCSAVTLNVLGNYQGNLTAGKTCVQDTGNPGVSGQGCAVPPLAPASERYSALPSVVTGNYNLYLKAPGAGNDGSVDVTANLSSKTWLRFDWNGAGEVDPTGRATFGLYRGSPRHIYLRERY